MAELTLIKVFLTNTKLLSSLLLVMCFSRMLLNFMMDFFVMYFVRMTCFFMTFVVWRMLMRFFTLMRIPNLSNFWSSCLLLIPLYSFCHASFFLWFFCECELTIWTQWGVPKPVRNLRLTFSASYYRLSPSCLWCA